MLSVREVNFWLRDKEKGPYRNIVYFNKRGRVKISAESKEEFLHKVSILV